MNEINTPIYIAGISKVTSNEAAMTDNEIGKFWDMFSKAPIKEKLQNIISPSVFAVYSDYENGHQGKYKLTIGYAVKDPNHIPDDLSAVTIPAGNYKGYKAKSLSPEDIVAVWQTIWATDVNALNRNYVADFEEYRANEVVISIGYE